MTQNYFKLFGMEATPALADHTLLVKKYQQLQKQFHPDFFMGASEEEQEEALEQSAKVNEAYKTLKDENSLLAYYLQEKSMLTADEKYALPADFLMEMMELNETLGEDDQAALEARKYMTEMEENVRPLLLKEPVDHSETDLNSLKEFYFKTKYLRRLLDRL